MRCGQVQEREQVVQVAASLVGRIERHGQLAERIGIHVRPVIDGKNVALEGRVINTCLRGGVGGHNWRVAGKRKAALRRYV